MIQLDDCRSLLLVGLVAVGHCGTTGGAPRAPVVSADAHHGLGSRASLSIRRSAAGSRPRISVTVFDDSGHRLPGATVRIYQRNATTTLFTDANGQVEILVHPGRAFEVLVSFPGFPDARIPRTSLGAGKEAFVRATMAAVGQWPAAARSAP